MIVHSTSWLLRDLLPDIDTYLEKLVMQYRVDLAWVSSADTTHTNIVSIKYNTVSTKVPSLKVPHFNETSFCLHTIHRPIPLIIGPLSESPTFSAHPFVREYNFSTYVGIPIVVKDGSEDDEYIGSVCMFFKDHVSHDIRHYENISADLKCIVGRKLDITKSYKSPLEKLT